VALPKYQQNRIHLQSTQQNLCPGKLLKVISLGLEVIKFFSPTTGVKIVVFYTALGISIRSKYLNFMQKCLTT
jgi:hypothetical protein